MTQPNNSENNSENNNSSNNELSFSDNFSEIQETLFETTSDNILETDNIFNTLITKFKICCDRIFAPYKITKKIQNFEQSQNLYDINSNQDFLPLYYPQNQSPTVNQINEINEEKCDEDITTIEQSYDFFYKKMTKTEFQHIKNIENELNINFANIEKTITKIKERLELKWENLIKLELKIKNDCKIYDKIFKMIKQMKETIGDEYIDLNNNLNTYIDDIIQQNNMINDIKTYKLLILECNFLKTCISQYHNIQVMKKNSPICKICYTNVSNHVTIPCGHLVCKKCIILTKTFAPSNNTLRNPNLEINDPITYSITVFNNNNEQNNESNNNLVPSSIILPNNLQLNSNPYQNNNATGTQTDNNPLININPINIPIIQNNNVNTSNNNSNNNIHSSDRQRNVRNNNEERRVNRRRILPRRIIRSNSINPKDKCPFCRQEIDKIYKIYY